jgi:hypothetical protein
MEAICSSETSVDFQRTARNYIPEDSTLLSLWLINDVRSVLGIWHHVDVDVADILGESASSNFSAHSSVLKCRQFVPSKRQQNRLQPHDTTSQERNYVRSSHSEPWKSETLYNIFRSVNVHAFVTYTDGRIYVTFGTNPMLIKAATNLSVLPLSATLPKLGSTEMGKTQVSRCMPLSDEEPETAIIVYTWFLTSLHCNLFLEVTPKNNLLNVIYAVYISFFLT